MKKFIFLILLLISTFLTAQNFGGGFSIALNGSQVSGDQLSGFDKFGVRTGVFTFYNISEQSKLKLELVFSQKGSRKNPTSEDPTSFLLKLNYVEIPLLFEYKLPIKHLYVFVGLAGGILTKTKDNIWDENGLVVMLEPFYKFEFSCLVGFNFNFNESHQMFFELDQSILPIRKHYSGATYYFNRGVYNTVITLGYAFTFPQK
ncbi:MAG: outer membrane beta-barrel protein [Bacteroidales bacterium]|jgi:hypothetical protein|nr:outer membrane beta-barrel protein [Bacteroidales bacterium]MDI9575644.1 outer membrane beta-barrel protein [Bacteroidota bacterium]MDD2593393.1 outer membrane beta-barrel protein [Bacteroidales bacterium]MDD3756455.1 outer membrane beta-barrel protein [Bacteroidales bacterium]MDY0401649.1 outer membrane beta-barrel protein [Bacteroidales bacterium]